MILVVDDHPDTVAFLCRALGRHGYEAHYACDGNDALSVLRSHTPRLVILDVQMPGLTGLDVLEAMQCDDRLRAIPVLIYSAAHEKSQHDLALRLGARAYVVKGAIGVPEIMALVAEHATPAATGAA